MIKSKSNKKRVLAFILAVIFTALLSVVSVINLSNSKTVANTAYADSVQSRSIDSELLLVNPITGKPNVVFSVNNGVYMLDAGVYEFRTPLYYYPSLGTGSVTIPCSFLCCNGGYVFSMTITVSNSQITRVVFAYSFPDQSTDSMMVYSGSTWRTGYNEVYFPFISSTSSYYTDAFWNFIGYNLGYSTSSAGYDEGYADGYVDGNLSGTKEGITQGYNNGFNAGKTEGLTEGYDNGFSAGKTEGLTQGYNTGYTEGSADGYIFGQADGYENGYTTGYDKGVNDTLVEEGQSYQYGYESGHNDGYQTGYGDGVAVSYDTGYQDGFAKGEYSVASSSKQWYSYILSIADVPFNLIFNMFNFDLFGVNISSFVLSIISIAVVITLLKMLL